VLLKNNIKLLNYKALPKLFNITQYRTLQLWRPSGPPQQQPETIHDTLNSIKFDLKNVFKRQLSVSVAHKA